MITLLRCVWETGTPDCTKYAAGACLLYQLAEQRLTEMTRGCLDTELGALIHSVSLAGCSRQLEKKRERYNGKRQRQGHVGQVWMNADKLQRFMGHDDGRADRDVGKELVLLSFSSQQCWTTSQLMLCKLARCAPLYFLPSTSRRNSFPSCTLWPSEM